MQFATRLREAWSSSDGERGASESAPELAPIELFGMDGREIGWIAPRGRRTSDYMNEELRLEVYRPSPIPVEAVVDWEEPRRQTAGDWVVRDPEDLLFVVPPSLPPNLHLRVHRRIVDISLRLGGWRIWGRAHIRPGAEVGDYLLRGGRRYVPLTRVELLHEEDPRLSLQVPVVIVNISHITHFEMPDRRNDLRERPSVGPIAGTLVPHPVAETDAPGDFERVLEELLASRHAGHVSRDEMRAQLKVLLDLS